MTTNLRSILPIDHHTNVPQVVDLVIIQAESYIKGGSFTFTNYQILQKGLERTIINSWVPISDKTT